MGNEPADLEADNGVTVGERARWDVWRWILRIPRPLVIALAVVVAVVVGLLVRGGDDPVKPRTAATPTTVFRNTTEDVTIADQLPLDAQYAPFLNILARAEWAERLGEEGPYTVFAPDATAFGKLPPADFVAMTDDVDAATSVAEHHIVEGRVGYVELLSGQVDSLTAVDGSELAVTVDGSTVRVGGAVVTKHDISASNGVIHVVDTVDGDSAG